MAAFAALATLAACNGGTEVSTRWLTDDWAPNPECREAELTSLKRDGSFTAPMNVPGRRALGVWSYRDGVLTIGNVFREERFRVERISYSEIRTHPLDGGPPGTLYRC